VFEQLCDNLQFDLNFILYFQLHTRKLRYRIYPGHLIVNLSPPAVIPVSNNGQFNVSGRGCSLLGGGVK
jgi:hypothetical protein